MENLQNIIEGCIKNDRISQEKLYKLFYPGLFAMCKKFFTNNEDILTALNNGMLNVFKNISTYDPSKGELFNWSYTIVRNAAISHYNSKKIAIQTHSIDKQIEQSTFNNPFKELEWKDIYIYLDYLPPATRAVCTLFYLEGFSIKEIAEQLTLSDGTIKWHLNESRTKLKTILISYPNL